MLLNILMLAWYCLRTAWRIFACAVRTVAFVLSLPFRLVTLTYKLCLACACCCLRLLDCYWRMIVLERSMLFSWIVYELVFSISLLIVLKATHALVWFGKRALRACRLFPENKAWRAMLKPVQPPGGDALCPICLDPFSDPPLQLAHHQQHQQQPQQQQHSPWPGGACTCTHLEKEPGADQDHRRALGDSWQLPQPYTRCSDADRGDAARGGSCHEGAKAGAALVAASAAPAAPRGACALPCGHVFCRPCVTRWLEQHQLTCPLCRGKVLPDRPPSLLSKWLATSSPAQSALAALRPLARLGRTAWSVLMALVLCGPFVYGWYYTIRFAGRRLGLYHRVASQAVWLDLLLCLVLFFKVLHRRCSMDGGASATA